MAFFRSSGVTGDFRDDIDSDDYESQALMGPQAPQRAPSQKKRRLSASTPSPTPRDLESAAPDPIFQSPAEVPAKQQ